MRRGHIIALPDHGESSVNSEAYSGKSKGVRAYTGTAEVAVVYDHSVCRPSDLNLRGLFYRGGIADFNTEPYGGKRSD